MHVHKLINKCTFACTHTYTSTTIIQVYIHIFIHLDFSAHTHCVSRELFQINYIYYAGNA